MRVKDLIKTLQSLPEDLEVGISWNDRYCLSYDWTVSRVVDACLANSKGEPYIYPDKTVPSEKDIVVFKYSQDRRTTDHILYDSVNDRSGFLPGETIIIAGKTKR
jgi:hypothetical protein